MISRGIKIISAAFVLLASVSTSFTPFHTASIVSKRIESPLMTSNYDLKFPSSCANSAALFATSVATFRDEITMMPPATIERTSTSTPTLTPPSVEKVQKSKASPGKERKSIGPEAWEVRIYNDGKNTREFVARCLVQIVGHSELTAYQTMMQAHQNGIAVVGIYRYEIAEMYYGELTKNGIVCDLVPVEEEK
jgi:ATP-dependent Clp protease adaptor protein ClpS